MAEVGALQDGRPLFEGRLATMEANGVDYFTFKGLVTAFMSGFSTVGDAVTAAADALVTPLANRILALENANTFVASGSMTTANLLANFPASATYLGKYARVNDLYGSVDEVMRCRYDGVNYRWVPQRNDFNMVSAASGTISLTPLVTPPTVRLPGTLTGNITFNTVTTNAYIGQRFRIVSGGLGIYVAQLTGLVGSNITLLGNTVKDIEYGPTGWFAVSG